MGIYLLQICLCFFCFSLTLYSIVEQQNRLIEIQKKIPELNKKYNTLKWQQSQLQYQIDRFKNPIHLMKLAQKPEFSHLKYPTDEDVKIVHE